MAEAKQVPLNGAYYGPTIPPRHDYHRDGRGRGCGPCCFITTLLKLIISIVIAIAIAALVFWLLVRPSKVKIYVEGASLTQFNLTNGNTLHYNLSLDISIRNPNKKIGIYFDTLEARAYYKGEVFDYMTLPTFYQGHKNTTVLHPTFKGQKFIALGGFALDDFNREKTQGAFHIDVKIYSRVRFKVGPFKSLRYKPDIECELMVPLINDGSSSTVFSRTKCDIGH